MFTNIPEELARDPWFKVVDFLQQNWAILIDRNDDMLVVFYSDSCGVFDEISFQNRSDAVHALESNGFSQYSKDKDVQKYIGLPKGQFTEQSHPNGRIYSSGRYWK